MTKLALFDGAPVRSEPFPQSITTGEEEVEAVVEIVRSGLLSGFAASNSADFFGGPAVLKLEEEWSQKFGVNHSVACNSATSALMMAMGAIGIGPGDEVIVSPYTMSATAISILIWGAVPVFSDIEPDYFCLDPDSIAERITLRTKAILVTDIHGQSSDTEALQALADQHGIQVVYDCAQAPGSLYNGKMAGTHGAIGVYSLNRHKNMQCGEGGIAVTNDDELNLRMQLIRNHGESLVGGGMYTPKSLVNMVGFNFRMTELEAAVALQQLYKMDALNDHRIHCAEYVNEGLAGLDFLKMPQVREGAKHVYYMHAMLYFEEQAKGIPRERFIEAVRAEGITIWGGYLKPLYLEPMYQQRIAFGEKGFPFVGTHYNGNANYDKGLCPVAEELYEKRTVINPYLYPPLNDKDMQDIVDGIQKVASQLDDLK